MVETPVNDPQPYTGPERRSVSRHEIADMVAEEIDERFASFETKLLQHLNVKFGQFELSMGQKITQAVDAGISKHVEEAFPPGPLHKHKEQHQKHIDAAANSRRIWQDIQLWAARGIILFIGGLLFLGGKEWLVRELAK